MRDSDTTPAWRRRRHGASVTFAGCLLTVASAEAEGAVRRGAVIDASTVNAGAPTSDHES
jgi:hypothetical protein